MRKRLVLLSLVSLLAACGFKLRGVAEMPRWLNHVAVVIQDAHRDLGPLLKEQLEAYNIVVVPNPAEAQYLLIVERDHNQQQLTSVSASTTPRQYQLVYTVRFSLVKRKGPVMIRSTQVGVSRQLTVNNDRILGSDFEESTLYNEMRRDAVMQILIRLNRKPQ
ncbi:hypothetical protein DIZ81_04035 [Legionella taurinensis]|uniref:LPS-assembly lipoprotein LptE n=1 Tax=Legionella taurinensis TaxID=70611 RepID=A0A3A5L9W1_9GAMM|nr:LPS assembly lipoprotein LptE [Legionella taurinensis]MDX1836836.1 LPS assembly lipoprotein LptE [Legionella taurinensis]PUT41254.1 hypothetical protein DB744_04035 [Legionella taurinensis]PUT42379.1 hypothetical protein DB746_07965 [Legionella taurinensis]PUT43904.1 hypothetical protein DB743_09915 [Legionella taurinensis]PUT47160.1 hypothetical protein DB745_09045 [Legionella taurinensis]